jgi:hypothetical protein
VLGCAHAAPPPPPVTIVERHTVTASFAERVRPRHPVKDVTHVDVSVHRREGPESMVLGLATIGRLATACYREEESLILFPTDYDASVTLTIDTRPDGTMEEILLEPPSTPKTVAMCLIHALAAQPLHVEHGPQHMVLTIDTRVWWTS